METFAVPSGKARLWVEAEGDGETMVFLHAGVADRRMWHDSMRALARHFRVVAYDRRGFGRSEHADESFSALGDLGAVLDAVAPARKAVLVGCSQGGRFSIDMALAHPLRVRALVLVAPAITGAPEPTQFPPAVQRLLDELDAAEAANDVDRINELEAHAWLDGPAEPRGRVAGAARTLFLDMNRVALGAEQKGSEQAPADAYERVGQIGVPTLVVWGDLDFPHIATTCRYLVQSIPGARGCEIKGVAHLPNLEQPGIFNEALAAFCLGLRA